MTLSGETAKSLIVNRARQLVNQLIEDMGYAKPPFLAEDLVRFLPVKRIVKADLKRAGAILIKFDDGYVIKINKNHLPARQNFSCAHEIGHILFNELKLEDYIKTIEYRTFNPQASSIARAKAKERLCDLAAAELMMPEPVFREYLSNVGASITSVEKLAGMFKTSIESTAIRVAETSAEPCITLVWHKLEGDKSRALHLGWRVGPGKNSKGKEYYMPVNKLMKPSSALYEAYKRNEIVEHSEVFKLISTTRRCPMESKGFGLGEKRRVISLAFLNR